jgi:nitrogen fixation/metabolism regulation signal transduction histidine kinase
MEPPFFYIGITDNGSGIPPNDIERIFEPYYTTKKLGIGLGLTVARRFIEEHGGESP